MTLTTGHMRKRSNEMPNFTFLFLFVAVVVIILHTGCCRCYEEVAWEKVDGAKPESINADTVLYSADHSEGIVARCFNRCEQLNCTAFLIDFERNMCYTVEVTGDELIPQANVTFYHTIGVKVPVACKRERLWQVERTLGAILLDSSSVWLPEIVSRSHCYEKCVEKGDACKSAQFRTSKPLTAEDAMGRCALSMLERNAKPQAYRASIYRDEYLQHQCRNVSKVDYCSYAEFPNSTLPYSDVRLPVVDSRECERRCDRSNDGFICRGYTISNTSSNEFSCQLHSEDSVSLGTGSIVRTINSVYREREPCLNVKVQCNETDMTVILTTTEPFNGRLYASGHTEDCGIRGTGRRVTLLSLPLPRTEKDLNVSEIPCGLVPAFSLDRMNRTRTMMWATIVVQFNPIIQRLGDQAIKVGCSLDDHDIPQPRNISVQSSLTFMDANAGVPPISTTVVNTSSGVPILSMRILDHDQKDAVVTRLGERLTLKIEMKPSDGPFDIEAGHLVASSANGESSYLLLNEVGCPTDPATFPALLKDPTDNRSLISTFTAFKFPESQLVRFNVMVKFCLEECPPVTCAESQLSYGRKRRSTFVSTQDTLTSTESAGYVAEVTELFKNQTPDELPLQVSIIVQSPVIFADPLLSRENSVPDTIFIAGAHSVDGLLCVDASLALGLLIFWLIIQIILIVGCLLTISRYRRMAIRAEEDRADVLARHLYGIHCGNYEIARRVRWADRNDSSVD